MLYDRQKTGRPATVTLQAWDGGGTKGACAGKTEKLVYESKKCYTKEEEGLLKMAFLKACPKLYQMVVNKPKNKPTDAYLKERCVEMKSGTCNAALKGGQTMGPELLAGWTRKFGGLCSKPAPSTSGAVHAGTTAAALALAAALAVLSPF